MKTVAVSGGQSEKIQIDDGQDVSLTVGGGSQITGIIYCPANTIELTVGGGSSIELYGECHHLIIRHASGGCRLSLGRLYCREATIELIEYGTLVEMDVSSVIHSVCLKKGSVLKLAGNPQVMNISLHSGSVIQQVDE